MTDLIKLLAKIQAENPKLRLGQIIGNAVPEDKIYYISDQDLLVLLRQYYLYKRI